MRITIRKNERLYISFFDSDVTLSVGYEPDPCCAFVYKEDISINRTGGFVQEKRPAPNPPDLEDGIPEIYRDWFALVPTAAKSLARVFCERADNNRRVSGISVTDLMVFADVDEMGDFYKQRTILIEAGLLAVFDDRTKVYVLLEPKKVKKATPRRNK